MHHLHHHITKLILISTPPQFSVDFKDLTIGRRGQSKGMVIKSSTVHEIPIVAQLMSELINQCQTNIPVPASSACRQDYFSSKRTTSKAKDTAPD